MEASYGVGVSNRYALFLDEDDGTVDPYALPDTEPKAKVNPAAASGKSGAKPVPAAKTNQKPGQGALTESKANVAANQKDAAGRPQNRSRSGGNQNQRPPRGDQENRTQRSPRVNNAFNNQPFESQGNDGDLKQAGGRDFRGDRDGRRNGFGGRGRGGPGGRGGPRGGGFGGKRDFNRHSGSDKTGVKATEKREGAGAHNWGKSTDDFDFTAAPEDEVVNGEKPAEPAAEGAEGECASGEEKTGTDAEEPKSDEPQLKTLEEYKREREEKRMHTQFNTRKANEGEDKSKWKKTYVLQKKDKNDEEEVEYEEIEVEEDPNKRRNRKILDIEVNFRPSEEGRDFVRRGRGGPGGRGRGGPREGGERRSAGGNSGEARPPREGGRGGGRGGRGQGGRFQSAPKFDDLNDFPSL